MNGQTIDLERLSCRSGQVAAILFGVTQIVAAIALYVYGGYIAIEADAPVMGMLAVPATAMLFLGIYLIIAGMSLGTSTLETLEAKRVFQVVVSYLAVMIAFSIAALAFEAEYRLIWGVPGIGIAPLWASITALIGCILLIIAALIYRRAETRFVAGVMIMVGVIVLSVGGGRLLAADVAGAMGYAGLTVTAWVFAGITALLYSLLAYIKHRAIPYLALIVGFLLYGIGLAIAGFGSISDSAEFARWTGAAIPLVIANVFAGITGIAFLIASSLGLTTRSLSLAQGFAPAKEPIKCPGCGASAKAGVAFCISCGGKFPEEPPVPPAEEAKRLCPNCGTSNAPVARFCSSCAAELRTAQAEGVTQALVCDKCGAQNTAGSKFCHGCGATLSAEETIQALVCDKCGAQNKAGSRFCHGCGSALSAE